MVNGTSTQNEGIWLLVGDGRQIRFYDCRQVRRSIPKGGSNKHPYQIDKTEWRLSPLPYMLRSSETRGDYQIGHDKRGSIFGATSSVRHTVEPHLDIDEEMRQKLMRSAALILQQAYMRKEFSHIIMIAPPHMLGGIRHYMGPKVAKQLVAQFPKDVLHCRSHELLDYIRSVLPLSQAA